MKNSIRTFVTALALFGAPLAFAATASAQSLAYNSGQYVSPGYEGWEEDADGTKYFVFGYMNRNWEEEVDVPVGPDNGFAPGPVDQGQPTHFMPRRNRFIFRIKVPANFTAKDELVWTLTSNGKSEKAFASIREDYKIDDVVKASETGALGAGSSSPEIRANKQPKVKILTPKTLTAKVGEPVSIITEVTDDGVPKRRSGGSGSGVNSAQVLTAEAVAQRAARAMMTAPTRITVGKNVGLHLAWVPYRTPTGTAGMNVTFDPPQIKAWEDTRAGANSPWAPLWFAPPMPADNKIAVKVSFPAPGTYVLRGIADDGALLGYDDVTVTVTK